MNCENAQYLSALWLYQFLFCMSCEKGHFELFAYLFSFQMWTKTENGKTVQKCIDQNVVFKYQVI